MNPRIALHLMFAVCLATCAGFLSPGKVLADPDDHWWDGFGTWEERGLTSPVGTLHVFQGDLIAGGYLGFTGGRTTFLYYIARWDGEAWHNLGRGIDDFRPDCEWPYCDASVNALTTFNGSLIVGGFFPSVDRGVPAHYIARWDGQSWSPLGPGLNGNVLCLAVYDNKLVAGGSDFIAQWDGQAWTPLGDGLQNWGRVFSLTVFEGNLIAAGNLTRSGSTPLNHVARWDGVRWTDLGAGLDGPVVTLGVFDGMLLAGVELGKAGDYFRGVARWTGSAWGPMGVSGLWPMEFVTYNNRLVVAGRISAYNHVVEWTGTEWATLGSGLDSLAHAAVVHDGSLFVGGYFNSAGGKPSACIARWDDAITAVTLEDLAGEASDRGIRLRWHITDTDSELRGVVVLRSNHADGPYVAVSPVLTPHVVMEFIDDDVAQDTVHWYRLALVTQVGSTTFSQTVRVQANGSSSRTSLGTAFDEAGRVQITYMLATSGPVCLDIFDIAGKRVRPLVQESLDRGGYTAIWGRDNTSGRKVARGVYVVRFVAPDAVLSKKLVLR